MSFLLDFGFRRIRFTPQQARRHSASQPIGAKELNLKRNNSAKSKTARRVIEVGVPDEMSETPIAYAM